MAGVMKACIGGCEKGSNAVKIHEAVKLAIAHNCWDGQDPHTVVEPTMLYHQCSVDVRIKHRGVVFTMSLLVEPVMPPVLERELEDTAPRPCYVFIRAIWVQEPKQVDQFLNELRAAGLEFTLV